MANLPLSGIRVLDLTRLLPGGLCTLVLADLGADVVKVEAPPAGDYARARAPMYASTDQPTASASFIGLNRNKCSLCLDLKTAGGVAALKRLAARSDVLVESFRPGVLDRLGVGYAALRAVNERIVVCSISGWGQSGESAQRAGHDINFLAMMGLLSMTGDLADRPVLPPMQVADSTGGLLAAISILAAVRASESSGQGQHVDVSLAHASLATAAMTAAGALATGAALRRDEGVWSGGAVCYQVYRCADGWVALGALEEKFWHEWCRGVGRDDLRDHRYERKGSPTHAEVSAIFAGRTRAQWARFAAEHDCCLTVVSGLAEALASPIVTDRGMVATVSQSGIAEKIRVLGPPVVLSETPADPSRRPAPGLGEHSREVLRECGLTSAEVDTLEREGALG